CRLGGGDGEDEEHEHLAGGVVQVAGEGDEIHVGGEQQELDRHEDDDQVLAVQEDAHHADGEQDRTEDEVVAEGYHLSPPPVSPVSPVFTAGMLTILSRSALVTRTWRPGVWYLVAGRRRSVSEIAATMATSSRIPATSNTYTYSVYRRLPSSDVLLYSAARAAGRGMDSAPNMRPPSTITSSATSASATTTPTGR